MTDPSPRDAAGAGLTLAVTIVPCGAIGLGVGALAGAPVPLLVASLFLGPFAGFALVYTRFKDL
jgi:hypothetical protein